MFFFFNKDLRSYDRKEIYGWHTLYILLRLQKEKEEKGSKRTFILLNVVVNKFHSVVNRCLGEKYARILSSLILPIISPSY